MIIAIQRSDKQCSLSSNVLWNRCNSKKALQLLRFQRLNKIEIIIAQGPRVDTTAQDAVMVSSSTKQRELVPMYLEFTYVHIHMPG